MGGGPHLGLGHQSCRFAREEAGQGRLSSQYHAVLAGVTSVRDCGAKHSHQNCAIRCRPEPGNRLHIERATGCRNQSVAERASQAATHCAARRAIDCRVEGGVDIRTDGGVEFPGLGAIDGRAEPRTRRANDFRAKSLNDGHIDGGSEGRVEPRSHPRIDPPVAGSSAGQDRWPWFAPAFRLKFRGGLSPATALYSTCCVLPSPLRLPRHYRLLDRPESWRVET